jgi:Rieske Fe-S protein
LSAALAGALGAALAIPAAAFLSFPARRHTVSGGEEPVDVGALDALPEGVPVRVQVRVPRRRDAWSLLRDVVLGGAWLLRRGGAVRAFSTVCPHAGCAVDWDREKSCFSCPCHDSRFDSDGRVTAGPSPRALDTLDVTVDKGRIALAWRRFRTGVGRKEPA